MRYIFFMREKPNTGGKQHSFIMVPATNDVAMAQTSMQAMVTRHQMHTCVNLPFGNGYKIKFKPSYAEMDGVPHPVLVILSSHHGAFKLPFEAGEAGYQEFQDTYKKLNLALIHYKNRKAARLGTAPTNRIGRDKAQAESPSNSIDAHTEHSREKRQEINRRLSPEDTGHKASDKRPLETTRSVLTEKDALGRNKHPTKQTGEFWKWMLGAAATVSLIFSLILAVPVVSAAEAEMKGTAESETKTKKGFAGFPVPTVDLPRIQAKRASSCSSKDFDQSRLPGLSGLSVESDKH